MASPLLRVPIPPPGFSLIGRSFYELRSVDPGFSTDRVLSFRVDLAAAEYADMERRVRFYDSALKRIRSLPGVESAGANWRLPIADPGAYQLLEIQGRPGSVDETWSSTGASSPATTSSRWGFRW